MPSNLVKTPKDERLWDKAKDLAADQGHKNDYAYITGIFQRMKGRKAARLASAATARAKLLMRNGVTSSRQISWVWVPLSALEPDEVSLIIRAEPVLSNPNKRQTYKEWWDARKQEGFTQPIAASHLPSPQDKGISIPPENLERAASRLRDPLPEGRVAFRRASTDMFVVPYRFAPVKILPPDPEGVALREDPHPLTGHVVFQGMKIDLENLAGSYREGKGWRTYMNYPYGEFRGSLGVDNDPLDVYVGPNALSPIAVVIHQHKPETGEYDEDKVMVGFDTEQDAIQAYLRQYDRPGFYVEGRHRTLPVAALSAWMYREENQGRPVTASKRPKRAGYYGPTWADAVTPDMSVQDIESQYLPAQLVPYFKRHNIPAKNWGAEEVLRNTATRALVADLVADMIKTPNLSIVQVAFKQYQQPLLERWMEVRKDAPGESGLLLASRRAQVFFSAANQARQLAEEVREGTLDPPTARWLMPMLRKFGYQTRKAGSVESVFYKVLATPTALQELGEEKLTKLSEVLVGVLREAATVDWQKREPVRARLRNLIRAMMRRYGYPADNQDRVVDSILRQTEKSFPGT